ncbi:tyrosine-type recombinase/integrase [Sphingobium yanoikuyae]|uniref:Tyrosine-type recombinase/integrase n=1 Tax=Sphingobium yanoikuyae TaxID=13690 RepID=A0AA42WU23_SPHYA|nr:tyrosine-type recombinase/integrase [Sphingobium yanoikuyae]MDH2129859.1 tyrosine-type recombinase/integrase [Sphingobium yanoikuyae]MDH2147852.1 tyrosine-type recombinase/integrase [Sphingobium yanoikuyae]MDH2165122.1 tyrosine-type recombinase/integrase [Sphingobium yanoikuyae]
MGSVNIEGVCQKKGLTYRRFRFYDAEGKRKDRYVRLPDPSDPRFAQELARVNAEAAQSDAAAEARWVPIPGSFGALAREFRVALAAGWTRKKKKKGAKALSANTMENYLRYVAMFEAADFTFKLKSGEQKPVRDMSVAGMRPTHVYQLRDAMADKPGKANNWLNVLKLMFVFAAERDWRGDNPADDVSPLPIGEHEPWPRDVLADALEHASPMLRLAIVTGLCTGQRVSDVIRIRHNWLTGGIMELSQVKTDVDVAVPIHPWWREEMAKVEKKAVTLLYDRAGRPFSAEDRIQERIRRLMHQLGHTDDEGQLLYTFHGLRKNACCYLLETGLSDTDVGAILGMTPETVRHYGKRARAYMIAVGASAKMTGVTPLKMGR